eukprot:13112-Heterococcus_DN1.PRE.5
MPISVQRRPYHVDHTSSRPIAEVKQPGAELVLRWGTTWEASVLRYKSATATCLLLMLMARQSKESKLLHTCCPCTQLCIDKESVTGLWSGGIVLANNIACHNCTHTTAAGASEDGMRPLRVRNVSSQHLYLTAIPNLRKQCFIYSRARPEADLTQCLSRDTLRIVEQQCNAFTCTLHVGRSTSKINVVALLAASTHIQALLYYTVDSRLLHNAARVHAELKPVLPPEAYITGDVRELVGDTHMLGYYISKQTPFSVSEETVPVYYFQSSVEMARGGYEAKEKEAKVSFDFSPSALQSSSAQFFAKR